MIDCGAYRSGISLMTETIAGGPLAQERLRGADAMAAPAADRAEAPGRGASLRPLLRLWPFLRKHLADLPSASCSWRCRA